MFKRAVWKTESESAALARRREESSRLRFGRALDLSLWSYAWDLKTDVMDRCPYDRELELFIVGERFPTGDEESAHEIIDDAMKAIVAARRQADEVARWFMEQTHAGAEVTSAEVATRLGASTEEESRLWLDAFAFHLYCHHRTAYRAFKRLQGAEAGLSGFAAAMAARIAEVRLEAEENQLRGFERASTLKPLRPLEQRPQHQPNAPTSRADGMS